MCTPTSHTYALMIPGPPHVFQTLDEVMAWIASYRPAPLAGTPCLCGASRFGSPLQLAELDLLERMWTRRPAGVER